MVPPFGPWTPGTARGKKTGPNDGPNHGFGQRRRRCDWGNGLVKTAPPDVAGNCITPRLGNGIIFLRLTDSCNFFFASMILVNFLKKKTLVLVKLLMNPDRKRNRCKLPRLLSVGSVPTRIYDANNATNLFASCFLGLKLIYREKKTL
jgi:hypothetical protein